MKIFLIIVLGFIFLLLCGIVDTLDKMNNGLNKLNIALGELKNEVIKIKDKKNLSLILNNKEIEKNINK